MVTSERYGRSPRLKLTYRWETWQPWRGPWLVPGASCPCLRTGFDDVYSEQWITKRPKPISNRRWTKWWPQILPNGTLISPWAGRCQEAGTSGSLWVIRKMRIVMADHSQRRRRRNPQNADRHKLQVIVAIHLMGLHPNIFQIRDDLVFLTVAFIYDISSAPKIPSIAIFFLLNFRQF